MLQPNMTVSGHKYEQMQETSHNLQHLGIRMMHDLNARRNNVEEAYKKAIEIGLEPEHITDSMPFTPGNVKIKHKITSDINTYIYHRQIIRRKRIYFHLMITMTSITTSKITKIN